MENGNASVGEGLLKHGLNAVLCITVWLYYATLMDITIN